MSLPILLKWSGLTLPTAETFLAVDPPTAHMINKLCSHQDVTNFLCVNTYSLLTLELAVLKKAKKQVFHNYSSSILKIYLVLLVTMTDNSNQGERTLTYFQFDLINWAKQRMFQFKHEKEEQRIYFSNPTLEIDSFDELWRPSWKILFLWRIRNVSHVLKISENLSRSLQKFSIRW